MVETPRQEGSSQQTPEPSRGIMANLFKKIVADKVLFWVLVIVFVAADLWTKETVISFVESNTNHPLAMGQGSVYWICDSWFGLVSVGNQGGPWGIGGDYPLILKILRLAALAVILYFLSITPRKARFQLIALSLIMGGAIGNIWDSISLGSVRDFLYFDLGFPPANPWPAFNLADSMICVGVILLAFLFLFKPSEQKDGLEESVKA